MKQTKNFKKNPKHTGFRTADQLKARAIKPNLRIAMTARPRCLGGHN